MDDPQSVVCDETTTSECLYGCVSGYTGQLCQIPCGERCVNCTIVSSDTKNETVCNLCEYNHYKIPDGRCEPCSVNCRTNTSSNRFLCRHADGYCEFGCENGYFGLRCDMECNRNCLENTAYDLPICDRLDGTCTFGCKDRYYGPTCNRQCSNKCQRELCERDGFCSVGCRFLFLGGPRCDQSCSKGCAGLDTECDQHFTCAKGCKQNYWGPTCQPCSSNCLNSSAPSVAKCLVSDGYCQFGCSVGKYGRTCSESCPEHCKDRICNQTTGECLNNCNKGYFGYYCNNTCSQNCPDNACYPDNGMCVAENCLVTQYAWYGPSCDKKCHRNCKDKICYRYSGHCVNRCIEGYFGEICNTVCPQRTYGENCLQNCSQGCMNATCDPLWGWCECVQPYLGATCKLMDDTTNPMEEELPIVSATVAGVAFVLLIVGTVVFCAWRRSLYITRINHP